MSGGGCGCYGISASFYWFLILPHNYPILFLFFVLLSLSSCASSYFFFPSLPFSHSLLTSNYSLPLIIIIIYFFISVLLPSSYLFFSVSRSYSISSFLLLHFLLFLVALFSILILSYTSVCAAQSSRLGVSCLFFSSSLFSLLFFFSQFFFFLSLLILWAISNPRYFLPFFLQYYVLFFNSFSFFFFFSSFSFIPYLFSLLLLIFLYLSLSFLLSLSF